MRAVELIEAKRDGREHALLLAYVPGRRPAERHDGEFADVGATVGAWLGASGDGLPGTPIGW